MYLKIKLLTIVHVVFNINVVFDIRLARASCHEGCECWKPRSVSCVDLQLSEVPRSFDNTITKLDFTGNFLTYINSQTFSFFEKLTHLNLNNNDIEGISEGSFVANSYLQNLNLSSNSLISLERHSFTGLRLLLHLDLSKNLLTSIDGAFTDLKELSKLNLCNNELSEINQNTFKGLTNLRHIFLCQNIIKYIHKNSFSLMKKLMYIVLKNNKLHILKELYFSSTFLTYIDLSECWLTSVPRGLSNSISYLQLRRNNITSLNRHTFEDCRYVSIIVLDDNLISEVLQGTFEGMVHLQQVWLSRNKLSSFRDVLPSSVQRLFLDSNKLTKVPSHIFPTDSLIGTLSLANNNISYLYENTFQNLKSLQTCNLSGNNIKTLVNTSFFNAFKLTTLDLSRNPLKYLFGSCFRGLIQMKKLYFSFISSNIPSIAPTAFQGLENLAELNLDYSSGLVETILTSDELLSSLSGLRVLSMKRCQLSTLRFDFMEFFPNLKQLEITSSYWCCDKNLLWFKVWLENFKSDLKLLSVSKNKCRSPISFKDKKLLKTKFLTHIDDECHKTANRHYFHRTSHTDEISENSKVDTLEADLDPHNVNQMLRSLHQFHRPPSISKSTQQTLKTTSKVKYKVSATTQSYGKFIIRANSLRNSNFMKLAIMRSFNKDDNIDIYRYLNSTEYDDIHATNTFLILATILVAIIILTGILFLVLIIFFVSKGIKAKNKIVATKNSDFLVVSTSNYNHNINNIDNNSIKNEYINHNERTNNLLNNLKDNYLKKDSFKDISLTYNSTGCTSLDK